MKIKPIKGTRDFYPEIKFNQNFIFNTWQKVAKKFAFENVDGPMLEPADLWRLKSGAEIPDQMYVFKDKGDREVAVRPELTPTIARMVAEKQKSLTKPIKWWTIGRCWRYERAQAGRLREFFQWNMECIGSESMQLDAEVIASAISVMLEFGFTKKDFYIRLGNRKLIEDLILTSGVKKEQLKDVSRLIDKIDKIGPDKFKLSLKDLGLDDKTIKKLSINLVIKLDDIKENELTDEGKLGLDQIKELVNLLKAYKFDKYVQFDSSIMRGFDYYTSTIFEVSDVDKKFRAIAGGGRYDNLVQDFGGEKLSGIGYAMGDVVIELFLKEKGLIPKFRKDVDYFVAYMDSKFSDYAIKVATKLRKEFNVEMELINRKFGKQLTYADKIQAKNLVIIGQDEVKNKTVKIKDLETGKEEEKKLFS